jgi:transcriptional regulator with XRE-family HTH domain
MDPVKILEKRRDGRTLADFAKELKVSPGYLRDILHGHREPGPKILEALGLERVVTYRRQKAA